MTRPFKGLKLSVGPESHYDAVVIGAGIGGLICANLLAKDGLRVLMVERHYMVGGYCSTFRRKGFVFDAASHFYPLLGNPDTLTGKLLGRLGIQCGWVKMDPVDHFHFPDGSTFRVPADFDTYLALLKQEFPDQATGLDAFFAEVNEAYMHGLLYYFRNRRSKWLDNYEHLSVRDALDKHFTDPKLKLLLTADGPHWGAPPKDTSFVFDSMLRLSYFLGNYYPVGGSQNFADELAQRFEERGGHILMKSSVVRITVEDGTATGVVVETGPRTNRFRREVRADHVVSNADMMQTLNDLIGKEHLNPEFLNTIQGLRPSWPCFLAHLGLRDVSTDLLRDIQGYYWNEWDPDLLGRNGLRCKVFVPTLFEPGMAPPGCHVIIIQKVVEVDFDAIEDWPAHKLQIERYVMNHLATLIPGFYKKLVVSVSASAMTSYRFTGNYKGAMLGWVMEPGQLGANRPDIETPLDRLLFTGHWTRPGGGITPVIVSAMQAAKTIARARGRKS
ncbi:MAG: NAD(P)/FAD-dependent oxidoreductase [Acidobacteriota bacterium]|nr:NAD(P)/FAD-dependent oxidoreductase [Acidobacteriota bacterium]